MERIDDPSNIAAPQAPLPTVSPGYFRRPSVLAGDQGTILTGDWATDVQEALVHPILAAGIALSKGDATQLTDAINILSDAVAGGLIATHNALPASESVAAHVEIATAAEALALALNTRALTPLRLLDTFALGSETEGEWIKFPTVAGAGKFCVQWGEFVDVGSSDTPTITLPTTMLDANYFAVVVGVDALQSNIRVNNHTTTQFDVAISNWSGTTLRFLVVGFAA